MHDIHKILFDYSDFIKKTDISSIDINTYDVIMTLNKTGLKFLCDKNDHRIAPIEIINFSTYENEEMAVTLKLIKKNYTIFDIGANIGWYSLTLSRLKKNIQIYAFEPILRTYKYLNRNIALNNIKNIKTMNFGFSDKNKKIKFYYYPEGSGNASALNISHHPNAEKITGRIMKLDDFINKENIKIDLIKCDVEGAELFVFKGAINTIKQQKPIIATEMLRKWSKPFNYHPNDIIELLGTVGYNCYVVRKKRLINMPYITDHTKETNFFFLHHQKHKNI
ncbi:hypothetical protein A3C23_00875 [Candidatus Roizmanbacteria bacterium RIFCSPHIGHO2_02_FULL_37_13b]|uniref:Methyltransferase FkbM domain-containing protein n=1 Tax=Candidatus Roizmanbacteria bacterium RIFCSPLOWO2_02_FULL_36_11 TaxID=1802071 RepID=A0A1F7JIV8_9BACT|nr:MAG: hypothetical protein A3C23_00875 [Candidatus Roizmanbacteria bacterium RIFCSPHIGHO2_02_FULL_37_13b]OGK55552.1 MAG: hypothetical protein A3H78_05310 [Candidatus Roizmanbacteria bacterium RIFCSPLOWO2_02_FULL_36_11]